MGSEIQDLNIKKRASKKLVFLLACLFLFSSIFLSIPGAASDGFVVNRTFSGAVLNPGDTFFVELEISAPERVYAPAISEILPEGWTPVPVKKAGSIFKASTNEWIWLGSLGPEENRLLVYSVKVPQNTLPGVYTLKGSFSAGRSSEAGGFVGPLETAGACKITVESGEISKKARLNQPSLFKSDSGTPKEEAGVFRIGAGTDVDSDAAPNDGAATIDGADTDMGVDIDISENGTYEAGYCSDSSTVVDTPGFCLSIFLISLLICLLFLKGINS